MRFGGIVTGVLICAAIAYVARDNLLPYLPEAAVAAMSQKSAPDAKTKPANDAGGKQRGAGARNPPAVVKVAEAKAGALPIERTTIGRIIPVDQVSVGTSIAGIVTEIAVKDGALVKTGDVLLRLDDRAARATLAKDKALMAKDQAALDDAQRTFDRIDKLVTSGLSSAQVGDDQRAVVRSLEAAVEAGRAQAGIDEVALSNTVVKAPFDGQLGAMAVSVGAYVGAGTALVSLTRMQPVYAEFSLPETDLDLARKAFAAGGLTVSLSPLTSSDAARIEGPVVFIDSAVDATTATFTMRAQLENLESSLWPGQSVDVLLTAGSVKDQIIVPSVAIVPRDDGPKVYVVTDAGKIELRAVTLGMAAGDMTGLTAGLKAGERVVIEGQINLAEGTAVTVAGDAPKAEGSPADGQGTGDQPGAGQASGG
jgi:membrane fusion protein, multidrug efflux system